MPDNRIIGVAWTLAEEGGCATLISKDINVRIKADALGLHVKDFEAQKVDADRLYCGYTILDVPADLIDSMYAEKQFDLERLIPHLVPVNGDEAGTPIELLGNEFVQLRDVLDESHSGLARGLADTGHLIPIHGPAGPSSASWREMSSRPWHWICCSTTRSIWSRCWNGRDGQDPAGDRGGNAQDLDRGLL